MRTSACGGGGRCAAATAAIAAAMGDRDTRAWLIRRVRLCWSFISPMHWRGEMDFLAVLQNIQLDRGACTGRASTSCQREALCEWPQRIVSSTPSHRLRICTEHITNPPMNNCTGGLGWMRTAWHVCSEVVAGGSLVAQAGILHQAEGCKWRCMLCMYSAAMRPKVSWGGQS